jgi:hypothetical protein
MKNRFYLLLIIPLMAACSSESNRAEQNIAIIENYIKSVEHLDYQTMESLLDEQYLGMGPSYGDSINKETAVANWKYLVENLYESIHYSRSRNVAVTISSGDNQGDWVSNWGELTIRYKTTEDSVTIWANSIYQIEDGKIVKSFTFYNEADALRQLGYYFIY